MPTRGAAGQFQWAIPGGLPSDCHELPRAERLLQRLLRLAQAAAVAPRVCRCGAQRTRSKRFIGSRAARMARRGHAEFAAQGIRVGGKRVARLMRAAQLQGVSRRHFVTTRRDPTAEPAVDLAQRDFHAAGPNLLWLADIVYIATGGGFVYLAWCSMPGAAASSAGPSPPTCAPSWSWIPWIERSPRRPLGFHPPLRPRYPTHLDRLRAPVPRSRHPAVDGIRGGEAPRGARGGD